MSWLCSSPAELSVADKLVGRVGPQRLDFGQGFAPRESIASVQSFDLDQESLWRQGNISGGNAWL
jgi:hypothetical protein